MRSPTAGFTLIEVVVTFFILSLLALVAVPAFRLSRQVSGLDEATERLETLFRLARDSAVRTAAPVTVVIDSASSLVWLTTPSSPEARSGGELIGPGSSLDLPLGVGLELTSARARFEFRPDGSAFTDSVYVRSSLGTRLITLNPWTGHALVFR
jgi:prepilin-type N-terminal cleavage/methylation domain-containing protein